MIENTTRGTRVPRKRKIENETGGEYNFHFRADTKQKQKKKKKKKKKKKRKKEMRTCCHTVPFGCCCCCPSSICFSVFSCGIFLFFPASGTDERVLKFFCLKFSFF